MFRSPPLNNVLVNDPTYNSDKEGLAPFINVEIKTEGLNAYRNNVHGTPIWNSVEKCTKAKPF